jgi:heat shock protein HslJ
MEDLISMRLSVGLAVFSLGAVLAGCAGGGGTGGTLQGDWLLKSQSVAGSMTDIPAGVTADATIDANLVNGSTGCNRYSAAYAADGNALKIQLGPMTLIGCQPPQSTVETAYLTNLGEVSTFTAKPDSLTMFDSGGNAILVFSAMEPVTLAGVTWHAIGINNGAGGVVSVVAGSDPTALFDAAGTVSGNATCNTYNGAAVVDGTSIQIGPLATTRKLCGDEALDTQESAYLLALQSATTWTARDRSLELRDDDGSLMVKFEQR